MPRDVGTGLYHYPDGTPGNTGQTIFSTRYNTFINDLSTTLNQALPVNMGGTGGTSAVTARDNIDAEVNGTQVTDFSTHVWESGSWWCQDSAVGAPGPFFYQGICYVYPGGGNIFVEARKIMDPPTTPSTCYVREKTNNVWGPWTIDGALEYVNVSGDTMTGNLTIAASSASITLKAFENSSVIGLYWYRAELLRWGVVVQGSPASDFAILRYNDGGVFVDSPLTISRATGTITITSLNALTLNTTNAFATNAVVTGTTPSTSLTTGALTVAGGLGVAGSIYGSAVFSQPTGVSNALYALLSAAGVTKSYYYWNSTTGTVNITCDVYSISIAPANGYVSVGSGVLTRAGASGAYGTNAINHTWTAGNPNIWVDTTNHGQITTTSDYRIKKDVVDLPGMWDTVKAIRPIKYTQQNYTPKVEAERMLKQAVAAREAGLDTPEARPGYEHQPWMTGDDIERWGFIAHELQETLTPSVANGVKDDPNAIQSLNLAGVVAALTKALQEAMARIETLEAAQATP